MRPRVFNLRIQSDRRTSTAPVKFGLQAGRTSRFTPLSRTRRKGGGVQRVSVQDQVLNTAQKAVASVGQFRATCVIQAPSGRLVMPAISTARVLS
jgi:hypothetical protein